MIDFFFTLLNFGVFLGFIIYYFRKSIVGFIKNKLILRESEYRTLHNQDAAANVEYRALQERAEYQKVLYESLERKIMTWQSAVCSGEREKERIRERYEREMYERTEKQRNYLRLRKTLARVLPVAFDSSANRLVAYFSDPVHCLRYNDQVIELLKKR